MRVIAGQYRSRLLKSLKGLALRPTSDKLRETLFNVLGPQIAGSHFIDLFAGTGAVGIEALSRGAAEVVFIENHPPAAALIRKNLESLGIRLNASIHSADALRGLQTLSSRRAPLAKFGYAFLDPPYANADDYLRVLNYLGAAEFLSPDAIIIAEHRHTFSLPESAGSLARVRILKQGDAALTFYRRTSPKTLP